MKGFANWAYNASWFTLGIAVASVLLFGIVAVQASTTISANIETGGTLGVSGLSSLAGFQSTASSSVGSTLNVTGVSTLAGLVSSASSTFTGALQASSTLQATGATTLFGTLSVTGASTLTGDITGGGGSGALTLTTTNAATSTATIGCVQTYATSTDTPVRLELTTSAVSTTTHRQGAAQIGGTMVWIFGTCP